MLLKKLICFSISHLHLKIMLTTKEKKTRKKKQNTVEQQPSQPPPVVVNIDPVTFFSEEFVSSYHNKKDEEELYELQNTSTEQSTLEQKLENFLKRDDGTSNMMDSSEQWCFECNEESCDIIDSVKICSKCGIIYGTSIDNTAEWRFYANDDQNSGDPSRCGLPTNYLFPESNMGTIISCKMGESYHMKRIRQFHSWNSMNYSGRNLYKIFETINAKAEAHGICPMIIEHAKMLYKKVTDNQLFRGSNKEGLMAICIHKACQDKHVPRSVKEIATIFGIDDHTMTKGNRCFDKVMNFLDKQEMKKLQEETPEEKEMSHRIAMVANDNEEEDDNISKPLHYVERFCSKLQIPNNIYKDIIKITSFVDQNKLILDNTPASIAASIIFMTVSIHSLNISKQDISKASQISEVTISKCHKKMLAYQQFIKPILEL